MGAPVAASSCAELIFGPGGRRCNVPLARACLTRSAWRRREYLGGAHRPDLSFLCGTNGLRAVPLREADEVSARASGRWGECKIEAAVAAAGGVRDFGEASASSRTRNRLTARRAWDIVVRLQY